MNNNFAQLSDDFHNWIVTIIETNEYKDTITIPYHHFHNYCIFNNEYKDYPLVN